MTARVPAAALHPHERICPACNGERTVEIVEHTYSTTATTPRTRREDCSVCDGTGVLLRERRDGTRHAPQTEIGAAFRDLRLAAHDAHATRIEAETQLDLLRLAADHLNAAINTYMESHDSKTYALVAVASNTYERLRGPSRSAVKLDAKALESPASYRRDGLHHAGVAQSVEHGSAKSDVAGSIPATRSTSDSPASPRVRRKGSR